MSGIETKPDPSYIVNATDYHALVNAAGTVGKSVTPRQYVAGTAALIIADIATLIATPNLPLGTVVDIIAYHSGWAATLRGPIGGAPRVIVTQAEHDIIRGYSTVNETGDVTITDSGYIALLIIDNIVNVSQLGAKGIGTDSADIIEDAVALLPTTGGIVEFDTGTFRSPYDLSSPLTKGNITFQGSGMPEFNAGFTALDGGTILQGPLVYQSSTTRFFDLGVDVGSDVCTSLFAGVAQEGLITGTPSAYQKGNNARNVSVICKSPTAAVHAFLYEHQDGGNLNNIDTVYGASGIVLKGKNINFDGLRARSHSNYDFLIKADSGGGKCDNINGTNLILDTTGDPVGMIPGAGANWDSNGLWLLSTTGYNIKGVNITNVITKNTKTGIKYDTTSGGTIEANITQVKSYNHFFAGADIESGAQNSKISGAFELSDFGVLNAGTNITFDNTISKDSDHNCFANSGVGTIFESCTADNPNASFAGFDNTAGDSIVRAPKFLNLGSAKKYTNSGGSQTIEDIAVLNTANDNTLEYLRRNLTVAIEAITGVDSGVVVLFGTDEITDTTMLDYSNSGAHVATFRDAALAASPPNTPAVLGMGNSINYDGSHLFDIPDDDDFSFGDGATDSPFSIISVTNPTNTSTGNILAKADFTTGSTELEWAFLWSGSSGLSFTMYDDSTGGTISRRLSGSLAAHVGSWNLYAATYDGGSLAAGIKVYSDGADVTDSDVSAGSYTAMENKSANVGSYEIDASGNVNNELTQSCGCDILFSVELSAADVVAVNALLSSYFDL